MKLSSILSEDLIIFDANIEKYKDVYDLISKKIEDKFNIEKKKIYNAFIERDKLGHNISPKGIALPHGRIDNFDDLIITIVRSKNEVEISNGKAKLFIALLTSNTGSNLYLKSLAAFSKLISSHSDKLLSIGTPKELIKFINRLDIKIDETVKVKDIMENVLYCTTPDEKIIDVVDKMKKYDTTYIPVVENYENKKYIGKIEINQILEIAYPEYVLMMNDLHFLSNLRPFEDFLSKEKKVQVEEIYVKDDKKIIDRNTNIIELGFEMVKNNWHHISVVNEENKLLGTVSSRDIIQNVIRA